MLRTLLGFGGGGPCPLGPLHKLVIVEDGVHRLAVDGHSLGEFVKVEKHGGDIGGDLLFEGHALPPTAVAAAASVSTATAQMASMSAALVRSLAVLMPIS